MIGRSAKSHQYYYYSCNGNVKEGSDSCHARSLPKKYLERIVTEHIKSKILNNDVLEKLAALVNQDLDNAHSSCREKIEVLESEVKDVSSRLFKLYDALETGKLDLNDLAPKIKELKVRQDELFKSRVLLEADMTIHGVQYVDVDQVKSYCRDLRGLLSETDIVKSKSFLRAFVEKVVIEGSKCTIRYKFPIPTTWQKGDDLVLSV